MRLENTIETLFINEKLEKEQCESNNKRKNFIVIGL